MKTTSRRLLLLAALFPLATAHAGDLTLWYDKPATNAMNEALPIGEGRIGGVEFGGVENERFQFNVDSLWTGDDHGYGAYQTTGSLLISLDPPSKSTVTCPSGQSSSPTEGVENSADEDTGTKWCVETNGQPIIWQVEMPPGAPPVTGYALTSGNDKPERDPRAWEFAGSPDGHAWTVLDKREDQPPFPKRFQEMGFPVTRTSISR